ncbi:hypothetical protein KJY73_10400 [Bowmanella sp. Y26]|uniref:hypothetical protein n=1 Tax=Bowmanella yangjiangensis TaxID=2811230 RepID=UPI001BDC29B0|nr:hypothetical protein [Bowmanella yangjiangensis]MBT1063986.1 hypothetical protein [Bowmanella yangjiangensis]
MICKFSLIFESGKRQLSLDDVDNALFDAGLDDVLVSHRGSGKFAFECSREAENPTSIQWSVVDAVKRAIPTAVLLGCQPDHISNDIFRTQGAENVVDANTEVPDLTKAYVEKIKDSDATQAAQQLLSASNEDLSNAFSPNSTK